MKDDFRLEEEPDKKSKAARTHLLKSGLTFNEKKYEYDDKFVAADPKQPLEAHTTVEVARALIENEGKCDIEARVLGVTESGQRKLVKLNKKQFLEHVQKKDSKKLRESFDGFNNTSSGVSAGLIGKDFTPLLGGPFNKQLYFQDYLRMISACFFAYHHDPVARDIVSILTDFTMGRGFQVHTDNPTAQMIWDAFAEANDLEQQFDHAATELSIYGENMWWKLPDKQARISFNPVVGEVVPKALIPRIRLIDPSNIAEIITIPEDPIKGVLAYVWLAPTQYQMWTKDNQPSTKFIYTQIPAEQIMHFKVNSVSNEKRGRSDYFPALGYMKRLRDSINYGLVAQQKNAAWAIDTTVKGGPEDIDAYVESQKEMGTVPNAGSEFVHTDAITRTYLANSGTGKGTDSPTFNWCLNMICMSSGIPLSYLGTHLSGAGTRANALVSTEPVAKRFERRRLVYEREVKAMFSWLMSEFKIKAECDVVFPELITQDRSAKLRDLVIAEQNGWIAKSRAAEMAAKELDVKNYNYEEEQKQISDEGGALGVPDQATNPLTAPGASGQDKSKSSLPAPEKTQIKKNLGTL